MKATTSPLPIASAADVPTIAFVWANFGPLHADRCEVLASRLQGSIRVVGVELDALSDTYDWVSAGGTHFQKITLPASRSTIGKTLALISILLKTKPKAIGFCHYEKPSIFIAATIMRLTGRRCFTMIDSKFDDYPRNLARELLKSFFLLPYQGALVASERTLDYVRMLGLRPDQCFGGYDTADLTRLRRAAQNISRPPYSERPFLAVARLVPKKNLETLIQAYAVYRTNIGDGEARKLRILGSGPLEGELRALIDTLGLTEHIALPGFIQTDGVSEAMVQAVALILPSREEQFGQVIVEAQALDLPVIVSTACGARDDMVRSGVNGFIVEPENVEGLAFFMELIASNEELWRQMTANAQRFAPMGSAERFAQSALALSGLAPSLSSIDDGSVA